MEDGNKTANQMSLKWHIEKLKDSPFLKNHSCIRYQNLILFFGGFNGNQNINTLFVYDIKLKIWKEIPTFGDIPRPRNGHSATLVDDCMFIIGGWLGTGSVASDEIYKLDLNSYKWNKVLLEDGQSIGPSNMHSADYYKGKIVIFRGGDGRDYLNNLIAVYFDSQKRTCKQLETAGRPPSPRANHGASLVFNNLFIFGGWNGISRLNDLHSVNLDTFEWTQVKYNNNSLDEIPISRAGMPLINYKNEFLILFGGSAANSIYLNDIHFYNIANNLWFSPKGQILDRENSPNERAGHSVVVHERFLYIYGGRSQGDAYYSDLHTLEIDPPPEIGKKFQKKFGMTQILCSFRDYFDNPILSDVIIQVQNKKIYAHQIVISLLSETFHQLFFDRKSLKDFDLYESRSGCDRLGHYTRSYENDILISSNLSEDLLDSMKMSKFSQSHNYLVIQISNFDYIHVKTVIYFLYFFEFSNNSNFKLHDLIEILKIAHKLKIEEIKKLMEFEISKFISISTFSQITKIADLTRSEGLKEYCNWYYRQNKAKINLVNVNLNI